MHNNTCVFKMANLEDLLTVASDSDDYEVSCVGRPHG